MAAGAILVAIVALALELAFLGLGRVIVSPGLTRTPFPGSRRTRTVRPGIAATTSPVLPATPREAAS